MVAEGQAGPIELGLHGNGFCFVSRVVQNFPLTHLLLKTIIGLFVITLYTVDCLAEENPSESIAIEVSGPARVIDGDTLVIGSQVIRINGIDAPEDGQNCARHDGDKWSCGVSATAALRQFSANRVQCKGDEFDAYRRLIATCFADDQDVGKAMVLDGMALAYRQYSTRYVADEELAQQAKRGLWSGTFVAPWQWRKNKWKTTGDTSPSSDCPIKGNISSDGTRIYHAPWSRAYGKTRIDESKGERWFCDEAEALAAGWRAPFR